MKTCGYCGKENEDSATQCCGCGETFVDSRKETSTAPAALPGPKIIDPQALEAGFQYKAGFQRADWKFIGRWIGANVDPIDTGTAWDEAALLWVTKLREDLGGNYFVLQSDQTILLCEQPMDTASWLLEYTGQAEITIKEYLGSAARRGNLGKDVVLVFSDQDDYYQYLSYHSRDGEQATSGGVCIYSGYTHIAIPWRDDLDAIANTIVHELVHDCLVHLPLPLWLNEGVAVTLQKVIAPRPRGFGRTNQSAVYAAAINWQPPIMWDELAAKHFAFWTVDNIQTFWAGTSFYKPGDSNHLSYSLAQVFVKLLSERGDAAAFRDFLEAARREDAGQTAAFDILGVDLGEIAGTFLGEGNWRPQIKAMKTYWGLAGWRT